MQSFKKLSTSARFLRKLIYSLPATVHIPKDYLQALSKEEDPGQTGYPWFIWKSVIMLYALWYTNITWLVLELPIPLVGPSDQAESFIFGLVFMSRDFEVGTVRPLQRVDRQSRTYGANFMIIALIHYKSRLALRHALLSIDNPSSHVWILCWSAAILIYKMNGLIDRLVDLLTLVWSAGGSQLHTVVVWLKVNNNGRTHNIKSSPRLHCYY